ncbi:MAG: 1-phosphofructokinase family hexose kinase [Chloroflexi bacterium]|nr:1-phosphofructokinase family hexose kinase [Chloroflexota bacterium]
MNAKSIATLTLNPCLDVSYEFPTLVPDQKVHAEHTRFDPGGNGINVGRALKRLGVPATNLAILAGEIGLLVRRLLQGELDNLVAVEISGETRINCTLLEKSPRTQYEVNGIGPEVPPEALEDVRQKLVRAAEGGFGVLTGSLPAGVPQDIYGDLVARLHQVNARAVVDTRGEMLAAALAQHPFLIKPNRYELELFAGRNLPTLGDVIAEARRLQAQATYVCVSLGGEGAVLVGPEGVYHASAPPVQVRSTVGAGDSLVGGLVAAFAQGAPPEEALRLGVACGSGTASQPGTALFEPASLDKLQQGVQVRRLAWE